MKPKYKVTLELEGNGNVRINPILAQKMGIENRKIAYVRFGIKSYEVKINISFDTEQDEILLSQDVVEYLRIPLCARYEVILDKGEIIIGPFIGMLAEKSEKKLKEIVNNLKSYVYGYGEIGGVVLIFSAEGIDQTSQTIRGFIFNPVTDSFEEGTYCYPASIFKRTGMVKELRDHFHSLLGDTLFNNYIFNKWEAHQWLNNFDTVKQHLPYTILYEAPKDVREFLNDYDTAYVKPIYGSQGL